MADGEITLPSTTGNTGPAVDVLTVATAAGTVQRQRVAIGDPITDVTAQVLIAAPVGTEAGSVTRPIVAALPLPAGAAQEAGGNLAAIAASTAHIPAQGVALKAASLPVTMASDQPAIPVSLASLPAGSAAIGTVGVTAAPDVAAVTTNAPANAGLMGGIDQNGKLQGFGAAVFHNQDNQALVGSANGMLTGGVAQILNPAGNLDRARETAFDAAPGAGIPAGTQQLAAVITGITTNQGITLNAAPQTVTLSSTTSTNRGQVVGILPGTTILVDVGTLQEAVYVTAVPSGTQVTGIFTKTHLTGAAVVAFAYNQARDATVADGTAGTGMSANATFLLNAAGGWEAERSASGELDGASGVGTAVAAEYEYNGNGPHGNFDRARSLQGKLAATLTLASAPATGQKAATLNSAAPTALVPGMSVQLVGGTTETLAINTVAGTAITFTTNIQQGAHTGLTFESFSSTGPGLTGFSPLGMGIEEEAVYDPASGLFYLERSATGDGVSGQNVVMESLAMYNGTTMDRATGAVARGLDVNLKAMNGTALGANLPTNTVQFGGTAVVTAGVAGIPAVGGNVAPGSAQTANPLVAGAVDPGALTRRLLSDVQGALQLGNSSKPTYVYNATAQALTATPANLAIIEAGTTKITRLKKITIWNPGAQTTAGLVTFNVTRSTTAGSSGAVTPAQMNTADAAFSGIVRSNAGTSGTLGTVLYQFSIWVPAALAAAQPFVVDFSSDMKEAPILPAGVTNGFVIQVATGNAGASGLSASIEITEE
jgi:hypothetical protein